MTISGLIVYRTITKGFDVASFTDGQPKLLASRPVLNESPFQRTQRESSFPRELLALGMSKLLQHGEASMEIDKVLVCLDIIELGAFGGIWGV